MSTFRKTTNLIDRRIFLSDENLKRGEKHWNHTDPLAHMTKRELFDYSIDYQLVEDDIVTKIKEAKSKFGFIEPAEENRLWRLHHTAVATRELIQMNHRVIKNIDYLREKIGITPNRLYRTLGDRFGIHYAMIKKKIEAGHVWDDLSQISIIASVLEVHPMELMYVDIQKSDKRFL